MAQVATAPPITLSMEEFRSTWEPQGWQLLIIGPTATWRQDWGEWEAIRDIVQNALDETEAYRWGYDDQGLWLRDEGEGISVTSFLLGPPKLKPRHARGKFGEGMKIAALALLRKGYAVRVDTVLRELWLVFLRVRVDGQADQLAALWRSNGRPVGTTFHIIGYFGTAFEDRFAVNIPKGHILHESPSPLHEPIRRFNQLISAPPGRIYARDIYMRDIKSPFSYNLWGFEMAPDRHGPRSETDVWADVGRVWATVSRADLLQRFIGIVKDLPDEMTEESKMVNMGHFDMGKEPVSGASYSDLMITNAAAWQKAWRAQCGENAVIRTDSRWDNTVRHLGYEPVGLNWSVTHALGRVIKADTLLITESQERLRQAQVIPDEKLTPKQLAHLRLARKIAERFRYPPIAGVRAAIIPPASDRMRTAGLYGNVTQDVFIALDQLERARWTVDTVIHEIAHHTSQAEDGQEAHNSQMTYVAARVVEMAAARLLDEELKAVEW